MPEYLDDPSVLTKDKLKSELMAHNVELPSGNPTKDVYVQLYLKNLTAQNKKHVPATTLDAFSSDEELPPPVVSSRSRSSGRKATKKTDKVLPDELDVTLLTDEGLRDELLKQGVDVGPIVASTRKLYEKKLQKLLDDGPAPPPLPQVVLTDIQVNHNGNSDSDLYSDKEDDVTAIPEPEPVPEPEPEPEPAPVVERPVRSRGKTPVTIRTRSSQHQTVMKEEEEEEDDEEPVRRVKRRSQQLSYRAMIPENLGPVITDRVRLDARHHRPDSPARAEPASTSSRLAQVNHKHSHQDGVGVGTSTIHSMKPANFLMQQSPAGGMNMGHKPRSNPVVKMAAEVRRGPGSPSWKLQEDQLGLPTPSEDSWRKPVGLLDTALLEEPEPSTDPATVQRRSVTAHRPAAGSKGPSEEQSPRQAAKPSRPPPPLVHLTRVGSFSSISPIKSQESHQCVSDQFGSKSSGGSAAGVEKIAASEQPPKVEDKDVLKELFPNDINSPTGINATCRRPIRGAAGRPVMPSDLWNDENSHFSPKSTKTSSYSYTGSHVVNRVSSLPPSAPTTPFSSTTTSSSSSSSRLLSAAPPAAQTKPARRSMSLWIKLFLLAIVAAFLFLVYQAMETNSNSPFVSPDTEVAGSSTA